MARQPRGTRSTARWCSVTAFTSRPSSWRAGSAASPAATASRRYPPGPPSQGEAFQAQQQPLGVLIIDQFAEEVEQEKVHGRVGQLDAPPFARFQREGAGSISSRVARQAVRKSSSRLSSSARKATSARVSPSSSR